MYCPKCGAENPDEAKFCGKCGEAMPAPAPPPSAALPGAGSGEPAAVAPALKLGIIAATVVLPIVGVIMGIVYLLKDSPEHKAVGRTWLFLGIAMGVLWALLSGGF